MVYCRMFIPRLNIAGDVRFQVDTGADITCLHLAEDNPLEIPIARLDRGSGRVVNGVGGISRYFPESVQLIFEDDESGYVVRSIDLWIAEPDPRNRSLNSLLGLDVLNLWRMNFDPRNELLQFFP